MSSETQDHSEAKKMKLIQDVAVNQTNGVEKPGPSDFNFTDANFSLEDVRQRQSSFCTERNWDQYHTPRNLVLALTGEVGELAEIFQWKGEVPVGLPDFTEEEKIHVGQEISDCLIYLVRLADRCKIDLPNAVLDKFALNAKKYPANKVHGLSKKYTQYDNDDEQEQKQYD